MLTIDWTYFGDDGTDETFSLPALWEICDECGGEGKHSHAVDGDGLTQSDLAEWDPDEIDTYMSGGYDQTCEICNGSGKVKLVDLNLLKTKNPDLAAKWLAQTKEELEDLRIRAAEKRYGA